MARIINCDTGCVARGDSDDAVVDLILDHMRADHPDLAATVSRPQLAGWVEEG